MEGLGGRRYRERSRVAGIWKAAARQVGLTSPLHHKWLLPHQIPALQHSRRHLAAALAGPARQPTRLCAVSNEAHACTHYAQEATAISKPVRTATCCRSTAPSRTLRSQTWDSHLRRAWRQPRGARARPARSARRAQTASPACPCCRGRCSRRLGRSRGGGGGMRRPGTESLLKPLSHSQRGTRQRPSTTTAGSVVFTSVPEAAAVHAGPSPLELVGGCSCTCRRSPLELVAELSQHGRQVAQRHGDLVVAGGGAGGALNARHVGCAAGRGRKPTAQMNEFRDQHSWRSSARCSWLPASGPNLRPAAQLHALSRPAPTQHSQ